MFLKLGFYAIQFTTEMIEFLSRIDDSCFEISFVAVHNRVDLLKVIYRETKEFLENAQVMDGAAAHGNLEAVQYLSELGASCSVSAIDRAASGGYLRIVKYLHLNRSEGCDKALEFAAFKGQVAVVEYLAENSLGMDRIQMAINCATFKRQSKIVEILRNYVQEN